MLWIIYHYLPIYPITSNDIPINVGKTMPFFQAMTGNGICTCLYHRKKNGDDWGMVMTGGIVLATKL